MIYFLLSLLLIIFIREIINYKDEPIIVDPLIDVTERKIAKKIALIQEYYIEYHIGEERMKDKEWMDINGKGHDVPIWRKNQIICNPTTQEGFRFLNLMESYFADFNKLKRTVTNEPRNLALNPNYLVELQKLNEDADKLFPEVFISIKRDEKLNELI